MKDLLTNAESSKDLALEGDELDLFVEELPNDNRNHLPVNSLSTLACGCGFSTLSSFSC